MRNDLLLSWILITFSALTSNCWDNKVDKQRIFTKEFETMKFNPYRPKIRFNADGTLKVMNLADLHYGEAPHLDWGPEQDKNSTIAIRKLLDYEDPDFVVFTGDQITGEFMSPNATDYLKMLTKPLRDRKVRWASVFGNHDHGPNVTRLQLLKAEQKFSLSYTQRSSTYLKLQGVTNYYLPIYGPKNHFLLSSLIERPVMIWWFFDSQGGFDKDGRYPLKVDKSVVKWFKRESRRLEKDWDKKIPGLAFFHVPTIQYKEVKEVLGDFPQCSGLNDDDVTPQEEDTGLMDALISSETIQATFVGHDHGCAWCCYYKTLSVCFNRHTGYGGYGTWDRGARVLNIKIDGEGNGVIKKTYNRMEDGSIIDKFTPNLKTDISKSKL